MKHCIRRLIERHLTLLVSIFLFASCVSTPKSAALEGEATEALSGSIAENTGSANAKPETETAKTEAALIPDVMDFHLSLPVSRVPPRVLDLPRLIIEKPADITLMSPLVKPAQAVSKIPEPFPPVMAQASKPSVPPSPPAAAASAKPAAAPKPAVAATPKPAAKPAAAIPAAPVPKPAALPPVPPSAARVEQPAAIQKAQIEVEAVRTQRFDLRFTGTGWTYLGDEQGSDGIRYETRRFEKNEAVFTLNPERVGEYLLQFRRQDPVEQKAESVFVKVVVVALPSAVPPADSALRPIQAQVAKPDAAPAVAGQAAATPITAAAPADYALITDPALLLKYARDQLSTQKVQPALDALNRYVSLFSSGNDELFYLYALAYEQNTPFRNIKKSYDNYRRVRDEYPRSKWRKDSLDRIAYLEKHFYGLR